MQAKYGETSFSPSRVFLFSRNSRERFWGLILWYFWIGRARHPGPTSLSVGGWLTRGDFALEVGVIFLLLLNVG